LLLRVFIFRKTIGIFQPKLLEVAAPIFLTETGKRRKGFTILSLYILYAMCIGITSHESKSVKNRGFAVWSGVEQNVSKMEESL